MLFLFMLTSLQACEDDKINSNADLEYIKYGTSFGECLGYCRKNIEITPSETVFEKSGWDQEGSLPTIKLSENTDVDFWQQLMDSIDFDAFVHLDSIIGCPDCADGGAEYIEIKLMDTLWKVVFEYSNEPQEVQNYIELLRNTLHSFEED